MRRDSQYSVVRRRPRPRSQMPSAACDDLGGERLQAASGGVRAPGPILQQGNVAKCSQEEWMELYLYFLESHSAEMRESARRSGRAVDRIVYFADFWGVVSSIFNHGIWRAMLLLKALVKKPATAEKIELFPGVPLGVRGTRPRGGCTRGLRGEEQNGIPPDRHRMTENENPHPADSKTLRHSLLVSRINSGRVVFLL